MELFGEGFLDFQLNYPIQQVTVASLAVTNMIIVTDTSVFSIQSSLAGGKGATRVGHAGVIELTAKLRAATDRRHATHALTAGLVGSFKDTDGRVKGTSPVVLGARVFGDAHLPISLVVWFAGTADF